MKLRILILMILLPSGILSAQEGLYIKWDYSGLPFRQFADKVERTDSIRFFFREEWVDNLKLGVYNGPVLLSELLTSLFSGSKFYFFISRNRDVVITKDFAVRIPAKPSGENQNFIPVSDYSDQDNQKMAGNVFVDIGNPADKSKPGNVELSGYITNRDTREAVAGVTVFNQKLSVGTTSNQHGFYTLSLPRGSHLVQFSFIGMKEKSVNVNIYGNGEMNVEMNSVLIPLKETVISAQRDMVLQRYEVGVEKINISSFRLLPTSMGESDIIKSVLLIPGVQSVGEGSAGFNVRGGSADQNLILLYGAPVYNSSHFFGFFSAVNSDIIKDVTLYKGGIPGRYGGRISSILDIGTTEGNRKAFKGNAGISPITTHMMVEGPIIKDTCTFILTGRTTYSNWLLKLIDNNAISNSSAFFYDINGKVTYDLNKNNKIDLSSYMSHDDFRFNSDTSYRYDNYIISLRWRHFFNSRFFSMLTLNNSSYKYNMSSTSSVQEGFVMTHKINSKGFKADFNFFPGRHEFNYGLDMTHYSVVPGSYQPVSDSSIVISNVIPKEKALEAAIYLDDKFTLNEYISLNAGIRLNSYFTFGPQSVMVYDPEYTKSRSSIIDTLNYNSGKIIRTYGGPDLRASLNFRTSSKTSLKINYNRTRQFLHLLTNTTSISPTDTWKLSDYYLKPQTGDQYAIGFYRMLRKNTIEASVEVYFKSIKNMVDFKGGTKLLMNENIERDLVNVRGKAYGAELLIKKTDGRFRWSAGYTYARTFIQSTGKFSDEIINKGQWFPANFDKPHDLVLTMNYLFSRRLNFSANYIYNTGRPITYPVSTYYQGDVLLIYYSDRNKYRIPDYSRLDISLRMSGNLKSKKIANPNWIFSVYNLLGRGNVYSIYFRNDKDKVKGYKLSVFGRAIPSLTLNFDFGAR